MSSVVIAGDTSGTVTLAAPSVAGTTTLTLPATSGTVTTKDSNGILSVNGIQFPATQIPSADANTLDDYEEGTWTPTAFGGTTTGTTTYNVQTGTYTKIGRQVIVNGRLDWSALTGTGSLRIGGLPFTTGSTQEGTFSVMSGSLNWSGGTSLVGYFSDSKTYLLLYGIADDATFTNQSCVNEAAELYFTCTYMTT